MPIIMVEGTECVGKTSFCQAWGKILGAEYQHYSKPDKDPYDYFFPALSAHLDGKTVICDRYILGEKIYAKVKGTPSQWKPGAYEEMLSQLNDQHAVLIIVWEYNETIQKRCVELNETFVTPEEAVYIQRLFQKEAKRIASAYPQITVLEYKPSSNLLRFISNVYASVPRHNSSLPAHPTGSDQRGEAERAEGEENQGDL
jgi:thymidylate kinase